MGNDPCQDIVICGDLNDKTILQALPANQSLMTGIRVNVDLSSVQFVEPSGSVSLMLLLKYLLWKEHRLILTLPDDPAPRGYMSFIRWFEDLPDNVVIKNDATDLQVASMDHDFLLPLTQITKNSDPSKVATRLGHLTMDNLNYSQKTASNLAKIVSELAENIVLHSESWIGGYVAAQVYNHHNPDAPAFVKIAIGDLGIGIKESLGRSKPELWSVKDEDILKQVIRDGLSRHQDPGRGGGLPRVSEMVDEHNGRFVLRSDRAVLLVKGRHQAKPMSVSKPYLPGTHLAISLNELTL